MNLIYVFIIVICFLCVSKVFEKKIKIHKSIVFLFFLLHSGLSLANEIESNFRCFVGGGAQKIKLEMMQYSDDAHNWTGGYVKYGKNKNPITIVYLASKAIDSQEGRPAYFETTWLEIMEGGVAGKYIVSSQGANVYGFEYVNHKSGKKYSFQEVVERNLTDNGCKW